MISQRLELFFLSTYRECLLLLLVKFVERGNYQVTVRTTHSLLIVLEPLSSLSFFNHSVQIGIHDSVYHPVFIGSQIPVVVSIKDGEKVSLRVFVWL